MKVRILGSGTSTGVPRIGGEQGLDWGDCDPEEPKNRRTRASILIENEEGTRLLIDTSTDLRAQFIANGIDRIDRQQKRRGPAFGAHPNKRMALRHDACQCSSSGLGEGKCAAD